MTGRKAYRTVLRIFDLPLHPIALTSWIIYFFVLACRYRIDSAASKIHRTDTLFRGTNSRFGKNSCGSARSTWISFSFHCRDNDRALITTHCALLEREWNFLRNALIAIVALLPRLTSLSALGHAVGQVLELHVDRRPFRQMRQRHRRPLVALPGAGTAVVRHLPG